MCSYWCWKVLVHNQEEDCSIGHSAVMWIWKSNCKHLFCSQPFVQQGERYFEQMIVHWSLHCISFSFSLTQKKQVALCLTVLNVLRLVWIQFLTIPATILSNIDMCHTCGVPSFVNFQACKSCSMPSNCSPKIFSKHYKQNTGAKRFET